MLRLVLVPLSEHSFYVVKNSRSNEKNITSFFAWCNFWYMPNQSTGDTLNFLTLYKPGDMADIAFSLAVSRFKC